MRLTWIPLCFVVLLSSCNIFELFKDDPHNMPEEQLNGVMLIRHKSWLYRIGGLDESGVTSTRAQMMLIDGNSPMIAWSDTASLPVGIRHGATFSAGDLVYVIGGETENGLVSTIHYTHIYADGTLGFGTDNRWESNLRSLPEARAYAAWALYDGWIFLIGGKTASGPTDSIIRARIYKDGQIGQWYTSSQSLPDVRWGAASAVMDNRLYVAGGANANCVTDSVVSFAFGEYGALSDRRIESDLPVALQQAVLLADRNDLILAGGHDTEEWSQKVYRYHEGMWSATPFLAGAEGPFFGRAAGTLFYMKKAEGDSVELARLDGLSLAPETPVVVPGSGMVPIDSLIHINAEPGVIVRYSGNAENVITTADAIWPEASINISSTTLPSMNLSLAAFGLDGTASPTVQREYRVRTGRLFVVIEKTLQIHNADYSSLDYQIMEESGVEGRPPAATNSLWYRVIIDTSGRYRLVWADADEDPSYSAKLILSVYEADLYTEVPDLSENPSRDLRGGLAAPLRLALNTGDYYIHIRSLDNLEGGDFGLSLLQE